MHLLLRKCDLLLNVLTPMGKTRVVLLLFWLSTDVFFWWDHIRDIGKPITLWKKLNYRCRVVDILCKAMKKKSIGHFKNEKKPQTINQLLCDLATSFVGPRSKYVSSVLILNQCHVLEEEYLTTTSEMYWFVVISVSVPQRFGPSNYY